MSEKISIVKFFSGFFSKLYWIKIVAIAIGLLVLFGVGYTAKEAILKPTHQAQNMNAPTYNIQPHFGGCATIKVLEGK